MGQTVTLLSQDFEGSNNTLTNISFRGSDADANGRWSGVFYWLRGIWVNNVSYVNFCNVSGHGGFTGGGAVLSGTGVYLQGNGKPTAVGPGYGVVYNFTGCVFDFLDQGVVYGQYVQGVTVNQCNFTKVNVGISSPGSVAGELDQLVVTNSQFAYKIVGIQANTKILVANISNCMLQPAQEGLSTFGGIQGIFQAFTFTGNSFINAFSTTSAYGILLTPGANTGIITGNVFFGTMNYGVLLQSGVTHVSVQSNKYNGPGANTSPPASVPGDAIAIGGGSS